MEFKKYAERIKPLNQFDKFQKSKIDSKNEVRISVKKGEMLTHKIRKNKFSQLNDKRFYFPNSVISIPFGHFSLDEMDNFKKEKGWKIEKYFWTKKEKLLELEKAALKKCPRIDFLNNILNQVNTIVDINCERFDRNTEYLYKKERDSNILDFILKQRWKKICLWWLFQWKYLSGW